jgi:hypothetical protein
MNITDRFSIVVLFLLSGAQLFGKRFSYKYVKICFFFSIAAVFLSDLYSTFLQYEIWKGNPVSSFLLPPHESWIYFASYAIPRFFSPLLISVAAAIVFKSTAEYLNRRFDERFLEKGEEWLLASGILLSGYPGFIVYIPLMLVSALILSVFYSVLGKGRAPLFYLWLPVAVFAILFKSQIPQSILNNFIF